MTAIINSLPPGFRFHPTDEELIHYLKNKVSSSLISSSHESPASSIIAEVDLYKLNPWELPDYAYFGDSEWFCFSPRDRKYPNGARPNRTATSGYWKATGIDKPIVSSHASQCLGVKKALIFYEGRAPKGTKTNWTMYEYRLADTSHVSKRLKGSMRLDEWVLCRIRHKGSVQELKQETNQDNHQNLEQMIKFSSEDQISIEEEVRSGANGQEDYDSNKDMMRKRTLDEALEGIKKVLSLGALDEQLTAETPNKRSHSDCSGNSTTFEISYYST